MYFIAKKERGLEIIDHFENIKLFVNQSSYYKTFHTGMAREWLLVTLFALHLRHFTNFTKLYALFKFVTEIFSIKFYPINKKKKLNKTIP